MFINENSLYADQAAKDALLKDKELLATHFWVNFLGISILYNVDSNNIKLGHYLKGSRVQLTAITDTNSDFTLIVKLLDDSGLLASAKTTEITRFNALLKQGKITSVDQNILRALIGRLNVNHIKPNVLVKNWISNFESGKIALSDNGLIKFLYNYAKKNKIAPEFVDIAKHMITKIDDDDDPVIAQSVASLPTPTKISPIPKVAIDPTTKAVADKVSTKAKLGAVLQATLATTPTVQAAPVVQDQAYFIRTLPNTIANADDAFILFLKLCDLDQKNIKSTLKQYDFTPMGLNNTSFLDYIVARDAFLHGVFTNPSQMDGINFPKLVQCDKLVFKQFQIENIYPLLVKARKDSQTLRTVFKDYLLTIATNTSDFYTLLVDNSVNLNSGGRSWSSNKQYLWNDVSFLTPIREWMLTDPDKTIAAMMGSTPKENKKILSDVGGYPNYPQTLQENLVMTFAGFYNSEFNFVKECVAPLAKYKDGAKFIFSRLLQTMYEKHAKSKELRLEFQKIGLLGTPGFTKDIETSDFGDKVVLSDSALDAIIRRIVEDDPPQMYSQEIKDAGGLYPFVKEHGYVSEFFSALEVYFKEYTRDFFRSVDIIFNKMNVDPLDDRCADAFEKILAVSKFEFRSGSFDEVKAALVKFAPGSRVREIIERELEKLWIQTFADKFSYSMGSIYSIFGGVWGLEKLFKKMEEFLPGGVNDGKINLGRLKSVFTNNVSEFRGAIPSQSEMKKYTPTVLKFLTANSAQGSLSAIGDSVFSFWRSADPINSVALFSGPDFDEQIKLSVSLVNDIKGIESYSIGSWIPKLWMLLDAHSETKDLADFIANKYDFGTNSFKIFSNAPSWFTDDANVKYPEGVKTNFEEMMKGLDGPDSNDIIKTLYDTRGSLEKFMNKSFEPKEVQEFKEKILWKSDKFTFDIYTNTENYPVDLKIKVVKEEAMRMAKIRDMKEFKEQVSNNLGMILMDIYNSPKKDELEVIFPLFTDQNFKQQQARLQLKNTVMVLPILKHIVGSNTPIKPEVPLTEKEIHNLLRMNNFEIVSNDGKQIKKSAKMTNVEYFDKILAAGAAVDDKALELKVTPVSGDTPDVLEKRTAELYKYYTPNQAHGDVGLKITHSYDVNLHYKEFDDFIAANPTPKIIPGFHGTGTVSASMILRFGFKVMTASLAQSAGVSYAGAMLGQGVYFGGFVDKTCGYIRDNKSFSRRWGQIGYLLELEAYIGKENVDHRKAGNGGDAIRSIEYCVPNPRAQLKIVRAHRVQICSRREVKELHDKYFGGTPVTESTTQFPRIFKSFKEKLRESKRMDAILNEEAAIKNTIRFEFALPMIPISKDKWLDPDAFQKKFCNKNMTLTDGQYGFEVEMDVETDMWLNVTIPDTDEFMLNDPEGTFSQWLFFFDQVKTKGRA